MAQAPLKVYVGYDSREDIAWQVCRHSLARHAFGPVEIHPLKQPALRELGLYTRPADVSASTEFSLTRFLTPYLADTPGWSVFVDCDFLFTEDIGGLISSLDPDKAVYVVQHDYDPRHMIKMDGKTQTTYPRKNWSSFIVFNGGHPDVQALTPSVVNAAEPAFLHRFSWVKNDAHIGQLDRRWNFLVGEYAISERPAAIHYTNGGPWFDEWQTVDYAEEWRHERSLYESVAQRPCRVHDKPGGLHSAPR
jgi:hypothetical protein